MNKNVVLYYLLSHSTASIAPRNRGTEGSRDRGIAGLGGAFPSVVCFNPSSVTENTRRQRDGGGFDWWWFRTFLSNSGGFDRWRIGGGLENRWRIGGGSVVVSIGGGSIDGGSVVICVDDRWWWRWVSPLSFEQRKREDRATKPEKKRK
ncbi:unnamed protein product [Brassica oleracea var. botrytis]|uniref:Uncharacterized protein n=1 Tax=Brassica cretica TaxID=69181 RepID=A0A8S9NTS4_BRACR|nr:hypothetical protein F2Q69_00039706 [Brassica cretica]